MEDIAVLGGGLLGRLCALNLAERGRNVSLYEQGGEAGEGSAAHIAAAMLAPSAESVDAPPEVVSLGRRSLPLWRALVSKLPQPVFFQENGSLIVWHGQDRPLSVQFLQHLQRSKPPAAPEIWTAQQLAGHEKQLSGRFQTACFLPQEGQLDNRQTLAALAEALKRHGVCCHWQTAADPDTLAARHGWVIDCRGIGAQSSWHQADGSRLRGVRGEVARVLAPEITLNRPVRLLHPRYPLYIAPKENHIFVVGATQIESESRAPASVRSGLELLSALYAVHPAFGEAQILELSAGLRPTLNHHCPEIRYRPRRRLIESNGLFRHGFMIAPAVSAAVADLAVQLADGSRVRHDPDIRYTAM
ncbi:FAD-dependent oxidoreductase [Neisseria leonii]|uniref:D-amino-acid oxidase n=1 Tax=Neisseria leonii TaxID=2995413 RepID=A0A9X4E4G0_9NEIS|nr:FAD-dependent oxidoreductase [Neisseria sp. 51.81]MDD9328575.1 FAD-binding oxidoreductase [Neisseria sp. 51.81]